MNKIKNIISKLKTNKDCIFTVENNSLNTRWYIEFQFIDDSIVMLINGSTLTSEFFNSLDELEIFLNNTFLTEKEFEIK